MTDTKKSKAGPAELPTPKDGKTWKRIIQGLGVISIEFQTVEAVVKAGIGRIVSKEDRVLGAIVTANLSFSLHY